MRDVKYMKDLNEIRRLMSRSTRFMSLSGLSGIWAGIVALIGGALAWYQLSGGRINYEAPLAYEVQSVLIYIALSTLLAAGISAYFFTWRRARSMGEELWNPYSIRLVINLFIPLLVGGYVSLYFLLNAYGELIAPFMLIFYGMGLLLASHFTLGDIRNMGLVQIALGCISLLYPGYGLTFWMVGFGFVHILYGALMFNKYER